MKRLFRWLRGLSPRVRGSLSVNGRAFGSTRSIPARAGEPQQSQSPLSPPEVYPRACGGAHRIMDTATGKQGLSPRVRGSLHGNHLAQHQRRSIPARAGEPTPRRLAWLPTPVYPRACGGAYVCRCQPPETEGLSPRVRGSHCGLPISNPSSRSIPARAGEPATRRTGKPVAGVYPRACGGA